MVYSNLNVCTPVVRSKAGIPVVAARCALFDGKVRRIVNGRVGSRAPASFEGTLGSGYALEAPQRWDAVVVVSSGIGRTCSSGSNSETNHLQPGVCCNPPPDFIGLLTFVSLSYFAARPWRAALAVYSALRGALTRRPSRSYCFHTGLMCDRVCPQFIRGPGKRSRRNSS